MPGTLIVDLPASRTVRNKFLLLKPPSLWRLLQQLSLTETPIEQRLGYCESSMELRLGCKLEQQLLLFRILVRIPVTNRPALGANKLK